MVAPVIHNTCSPENSTDTSFTDEIAYILAKHLPQCDLQNIELIGSFSEEAGQALYKALISVYASTAIIVQNQHKIFR